MTHTLHREGAEESKQEDFVLLCMTEPGVNQKGSQKIKKQVFDILGEENPVNMGEMHTGNLFNHEKTTLRKNLQDNSFFHGVYDAEKKVITILRKLKERDFGLNIVLTGHSPTVQQICEKIDQPIHTIEHSAGLFGDTTLLAEQQYRKITTMCGHGLISKQLVKDIVGKIKKEELSLEEGARKVAEPCECGIFNPMKAKKILKKLISSPE